MTQRRNDRDAISNYFDWLLRGIGHRGSSFTDVDALTHDGATGRFLLQEFKRGDEPLNDAQRWAFRDLAKVAPDKLTVWFVRRRDDGRINFAVFGSGCPAETISIRQYQDRFRQWWQASEAVKAKAS